MGAFTAFTRKIEKSFLKGTWYGVAAGPVCIVHYVTLIRCNCNCLNYWACCKYLTYVRTRTEYIRVKKIRKAHVGIDVIFLDLYSILIYFHVIDQNLIIFPSVWYWHGKHADSNTGDHLWYFVYCCCISCCLCVQVSQSLAFSSFLLLYIFHSTQLLLLWQTTNKHYRGTLYVKAPNKTNLKDVMRFW